MQRAAVFLAATLFTFTAAAIELEDGTLLFDEETPVPAQVFALETCGADEHGMATRRPFAGGFLFAFQCPGNNENSVQTLIFAGDESGTDAHLMVFPLPAHRGGGTQDTLSNIRRYPDTNELAEIFVDREMEQRVDPNICRTEGRWRLEENPPEPRLVFWRETADCEGKTGWKVVVGTP